VGDGEGGQNEGMEPLAPLAPLAPFNPPREEGQEFQEGQEIRTMELAPFNGNGVRRYTEVALAERDGMADCPRCGAGFFAVEGSPALCSGCKGALGLLGRRA
jgi:hypothetical protein